MPVMIIRWPILIVSEHNPDFDFPITDEIKKQIDHSYIFFKLLRRYLSPLNLSVQIQFVFLCV